MPAALALGLLAQLRFDQGDWRGGALLAALAAVLAAWAGWSLLGDPCAAAIIRATSRRRRCVR
jgi:hypothetical protein